MSAHGCADRSTLSLAVTLSNGIFISDQFNDSVNLTYKRLMQKTQSALLSPLEQWNKHIHAFVSVADTCPVEGVLSGMTVGVKDIIDVEGLPTKNGSAACQAAMPALDDAVVVASLRAAGASIIGKTTTTEFAFTDPSPCRNPHDLNRSPGGSSSGSGAAVAAGIVDIALGTQTAGSLCRPAAYCGVVGYKPTAGLFSPLGVTPLAPSFDTIGIIARTTAHVSKALQVIAPQHHCQNPVAINVACGLWETSIEAHADWATALEDASKAIAEHCEFVCKRNLSSDISAIVSAHRTIMNAEAAVHHAAILSDGRYKLLKPKFLSAIRSGVKTPPICSR